MQRALLNSMSDWGLFAVFEALAVAFAVGGLVAVNRWLSHWKTELSGGVVSAVGAMVTTFFALMLAFAIVTLDQQYQDAQSNVQSEANSLSEIARDSLSFPVAARTRIQGSIANYVRVVRDKEFPALRNGDIDPGPSTELNNLFDAMQSYSPEGTTQEAFYTSAVDKLNIVVAERRDRVDGADSSLPGSFQFMLLFTGFLSIAVTLFFKSDVRGLEIALVSAVASVVAIGLLTVLLLQYPFSGSLSVSSDPYTHGYLSHVLSLYP